MDRTTTPALRCNESLAEDSSAYNASEAKLDTLTMDPLEPKHVEWVSPDGKLKVCYNLSTILRCADNKTKHLRQPPHFRGPMSIELREAIKRDFPEEYSQYERLRLEKTQREATGSGLQTYEGGVLAAEDGNFVLSVLESMFDDSYIEDAVSQQTVLLNWGRAHSVSGDLYCCPLCYGFLCQYADRDGAPDSESDTGEANGTNDDANGSLADGNEEGSEEETENYAYLQDATKDPMMLIFDYAKQLATSGDIHAMNSISHILSSSQKLMKEHLHTAHGLDRKLLTPGAGCNGLLKTYRIRDSDSLVQRYWRTEGRQIYSRLYHKDDERPVSDEGESETESSPGNRNRGRNRNGRNNSIITSDKVSVKAYWSHDQCIRKLIFLELVETVRNREENEFVSDEHSSSASSASSASSSSSSSGSSSGSNSSITSWELLVPPEEADDSAFFRENGVKIFRDFMHPYSRKADEDDREAIVSDASDDGSSGEFGSGVSMYAQFDRSIDEPESTLSILGRGRSRRGGFASIAGDMLTSSSESESDESNVEEDGEEDGEDDEDGKNGKDDEYQIGQTVYVSYDDGGSDGAKIYVASVIDTSRKYIKICYECDDSVETIHRWALVERFVSKRVYESRTRRQDEKRRKNASRRRDRVGHGSRPGSKGRSGLTTSPGESSSGSNSSSASNSEEEASVLFSHPASLVQAFMDDEEDDEEDDNESGKASTIGEQSQSLSHKRPQTRKYVKEQQTKEELERKKRSRKRVVLSESEEELVDEQSALVPAEQNHLLHAKRRRVMTAMLDDEEED